MKPLLLLVVVTLISFTPYAQQKLEVIPYYRYDAYSKLVYQLGQRPSTDTVTMQGNSLGIDVNYIIHLPNSLSVRIGSGYYRYSFSKIKKINSFLGESRARNIEVISPLLIPYFTGEYYYHSIVGSISLGKDILLSRSRILSGTIGIKNYSTFNQTYRLSFNDQYLGDNVKKHAFDYFGTSVYATVSYLKSYRNFSIGPDIIIPVYDTWKTDPIFPGESSDEMRNKWFKGIGAGITCRISFKQP